MSTFKNLIGLDLQILTLTKDFATILYLVTPIMHLIPSGRDGNPLTLPNFMTLILKLNFGKNH